MIGIVVDERGEPIAGAIISVEHATTPTSEIGIVTNKGGKFGISLPNGTYVLKARCSDGREATLEVTVPNDQDLEMIARLSRY